MIYVHLQDIVRSQCSSKSSQLHFVVDNLFDQSWMKKRVSDRFGLDGIVEEIKAGGAQVIFFRSYQMASSHHQVHRTGKNMLFAGMRCSAHPINCTSNKSKKALRSGDQVYSFYKADHILYLYHSVLKTFNVLFSLQPISAPNQPVSQILFLTWALGTLGTNVDQEGLFWCKCIPCTHHSSTTV